MVSVSDVYHEVGSQFSDGLDLHYLGRLNVDQWATAMERLVDFRTAGRDDRFFDIDFRAMQADPIGEVGALYDWLGEPVSAEFEAGMARWWAGNAEHREANIHPEPAAFGLDLDEVRTRFADYTARLHDWTGR
jgi:Sulfotransferase family